VIIGMNANDDYIHSQLFGKDAAFYMSAARKVIFDVFQIVVGVALICTGVGAVAGVCMVISDVLSLASTGAELAGDKQLSEDLGWAALAVAIAPSVVSTVSSVGAGVGGGDGDSSPTNSNTSSEASGQPGGDNSSNNPMGLGNNADPLQFAQRPPNSMGMLRQFGETIGKYFWNTQLRSFAQGLIGSIPAFVKLIIGVPLVFGAYLFGIKLESPVPIKFNSASGQLSSWDSSNRAVSGIRIFEVIGLGLHFPALGAD
jgi:hypothetical protein